MTTLITDRELERRLIRRRHAWGGDRFDEVWEGVYIMNAQPNNNHQTLVGRLSHILSFLVDDPGLGTVHPGCNVSDQRTKWKQNYRCPDVAVFLKTNTWAIDKETHWFGGPDLAIEIVSPRDRSREKLDFYARVGTRELLILDRQPWSLELYRLSESTLTLVGRCTVEQPEPLQTQTVPLQWKLIPGSERPLLELTECGGSHQWVA